MNSSKKAAARRWLVVTAVLLLSALAAPAMAQSCNGFANSLAVDPAAQNANEFDAGNNYGPVTATLTIKNTSSLPAGASLAWTQTGGPAVTLNTSNPLRPTFVAPTVGAAGATLGFSVQARCSGVAVGSPALASVTILNVDRPPVVTALASPPIADAGDLVTLTATGSDPDGDAIAYTWTQIAGTPAVSLSAPGAASTTFVAPTVPAEVTLQFRVEAQSGTLARTATVNVTVTAANLPPFATLSCPSVVDEGVLFRLDGTGSYDPEGAALTYEWFIDEIEVGLGFSLAGESGDYVDRIAPNLGLGMAGGVEVRLRVRESPTVFSDATCAFMVADATAPVISGDGDRTVDATSPAGADVAYGLSATDNVEGDVSADLVCVPPSGSPFALNVPTDVDCEVSDLNGNRATAEFVVTVLDLTAPVIDAHDDVAMEATGPLTAVAYDAPGTFDVVDVDLVATCSPASATTFAVGSHTITCNAEDAAGNVATSTTFALTVLDSTAPVITVPAPITAEATSSLGAAVTFSVSASDIADPDVPVVCTPASGSTFALGGPHTVDCSATDDSGNAGNASFSVTVVDTTAPVVTPPANATAEATGPLTAVAYGTATAFDVVGVVSLTSNAPASFPLGTTTITWTACDAVPNCGTATSTVTVTDTTPPALTLPGNFDDVEATSASGAVVMFVATAQDLVDGTVAVSCTPASGSTFWLGATTVNCSANDSAIRAGFPNGNVATGSFSVTVVDTTPPAIAPHDPIGPVEATGPGGASVVYDSPATSDLVDGVGTATCAPASGSTFPLGIATVTCNATDGAGNPATPTTFTIWVVDTTAPVIAPHADVGPVEATGPAGAVASYTSPSTSDAVDGAGTATCAPASGSIFAIGATTVTCTASDAAANAAIPTSFTVIVRDTTAPVIAAHANLVAEATGPSGASVAYTSPSTSDAVDGTSAAICTPASGSTFPLGTTTVGCDATDAAGNVATPTSFTVTVRDTTAPTLFGVSGNLAVNASSAAGAVVSWPAPTATDIVDDPEPAVSCSSATTPALTSGSTFPVGTTTVTCTATDTHGNRASQGFTVTVSYAWTGFFQPVDNARLNRTKAGSAVPVKFSLGGDMGLAVFASGYPRSVMMACDTSAVIDDVEATVNAGGSSLTYDAVSGQYVYVWKTDKAWGGTCRQLQLRFADGSVRTANFQFTR